MRRKSASRHARGLMCLTGHPAIRTGCSHSLRGCGDLCRRCRRSGQGRDYRFLRRTAMPRWSFGISQIHGSVRAGGLSKSLFVISTRLSKRHDAFSAPEWSRDPLIPPRTRLSVVEGATQKHRQSLTGRCTLLLPPRPDPTELVRSASLSLPELRGRRTHSRWKNCQRRWSHPNPALYFFERTMPEIQ